MTTPTKQPNLSTSILTPSCDITPTRETAREDDAYEDGFALTQNDCSEAAARDDAAPCAPAVSVEPAYDATEPSPSSPFTYDGDGDRAEPAGGLACSSTTSTTTAPISRCPRAPSIMPNRRSCT